jgi:hypothetical protein
MILEIAQGEETSPPTILAKSEDPRVYALEL